MRRLHPPPPLGLGLVGAGEFFPIASNVLENISIIFSICFSDAVCIMFATSARAQAACLASEGTSASSFASFAIPRPTDFAFALSCFVLFVNSRWMYVRKLSKVLSAADFAFHSRMAASYSPEASKAERATASHNAACALMPHFASCRSYLSPRANIVAGAST